MEQSQQKQKLVVVAGGTGKCGYHIVDDLLKRGFIVRLITRNRLSAKKVLGENFDKVSNEIIEIDLGKEAFMLEKKILQGYSTSIVEQAFLPGPNGEKVSYFISALGKSKTERAKYMDYIAMRLLIDICKKNNVDKFILISALGINRPYNPIVFLINQIGDYTFHWKTFGENYLRRSGIDYTIVRPGGLAGNQSKSQLHEYTIAQGDNFMGQQIHVKTVAKVLVDSIQNQSLPKKLTFEVSATGSQLKNVLQEKDWQSKISGLVSDTEKSIVTANHILAGRVIKTFLLAALVLLCAYLFIK